MKLFLAIAALLAAGSLAAAKQPFERYQSIIDRHPFGVPPPGFDPTRSPTDAQALAPGLDEPQRTAEQAQIAAAVRLSAIVVSPDGTATVGFTDVSDPKAPKNYCLKKGESQNEWTVRDINPVKETMTVERNGIEVTLKCGETSGGKDSKKPGAYGSGGMVQPGMMMPGRRSPLLGGRPGGAMPGAALATLRERRAMREQQRQQALAQAEQERAAQAQRAAEDKAAREQEREEQRRALEAIREELKRSRDERERQREAERDAASRQAAGEGANGGANDNS